jgi:hypothetical protein
MSTVRVLCPVVAESVNIERTTNKSDLSRIIAGKVRVGLLDNSKPNARLLLDDVGVFLIERDVAASIFLADKTDSPGPNPANVSATDAVFQKLSQEVDVVVTGLAN